jgi:hypothetical protein
MDLGCNRMLALKLAHRINLFIRANCLRKRGNEKGPPERAFWISISILPGTEKSSARFLKWPMLQFKSQLQANPLEISLYLSCTRQCCLNMRQDVLRSNTLQKIGA